MGKKKKTEVSSLVFDADELFKDAKEATSYNELTQKLDEYQDSKEYQLEKNREMNQVAQIMDQVVGAEKY